MTRRRSPGLMGSLPGQVVPAQDVPHGDAIASGDRLHGVARPDDVDALTIARRARGPEPEKVDRHPPRALHGGQDLGRGPFRHVQLEASPRRGDALHQGGVQGSQGVTGMPVEADSHRRSVSAGTATRSMAGGLGWTGSNPNRWGSRPIWATATIWGTNSLVSRCRKPVRARVQKSLDPRRSDGPRDRALARVVRGLRQKPRAKEVVEVAEVGGRRDRRLLGIEAFVDPLIDPQPVALGRRGHELPEPPGPGPRGRHGVEPALDHGRERQVLRQSVSLQGLSNHRHEATRTAEPGADDLAALAGEPIDEKPTWEFATMG